MEPSYPCRASDKQPEVFGLAGENDGIILDYGSPLTNNCQESPIIPTRPANSADILHKNPWFIITFDEMMEIRERLDHIEDVLPDTYRFQAGEIARIIDLVEQRLP